MMLTVVTSLGLVAVGLIGYLLNQSILMQLVSLEVASLGVALLWLVSSTQWADIQGLIAALTVITCAGSESALGLSIIVHYSRSQRSVVAVRCS